MRILLLSFTFPPNKDGVSEAASAVVKGFMQRGWEVTVLTERTIPEREQFVFEGARILEYYINHDKCPSIQIQGVDESYSEFLQTGGWNVLMVQGYGPSLQATIPHFKDFKGKKILVSHGYAPFLWVPNPKFPFGLGQWAKTAKRGLGMFGWIRRLDRLVVLDALADLRGFSDHLIAKTAGFPGIRVIPNGVQIHENRGRPLQFREQLGIPDQAFVFLCVANYSNRKDQGFAARAFRRAAIPDSVLVFIGSEFNGFSRAFQDEDRPNMTVESKCRIIWLEKQSRETTIDAFAGCDTFVLSSYHEAQPIALLEAMRESKPWIARDAGCIANMVGGICIRSQNAMTRAMTILHADRQLRERLGGEGFRAVSNTYNRDRYIESYCNLVEELTTERHKN